MFWWYYLLGFVLGAALGSFAGVLIERLHYDRGGIFTGRSRCDHCQKVLGSAQLIPLLSWLYYKGKCAFCTKALSVRYPLIELTFGGLFALFFGTFYEEPIQLFWMSVFVFFLLVLFFYDVWYLEVDDRIILPFVVLILLWLFTQNLPLGYHLLGGLIGGGFYALQYYLSGGKWVGAGDMRLGFVLGLLLGVKLLLLALFLSYLLGTLVAMYLLFFRKYSWGSALPMGAFLMPMGILFLYNGEGIWNLYCQVLGLPPNFFDLLWY